MPLDPARHWHEYPLTVLDFETTGVDPLTCAPVSVAAVRYEGGVEVGSYYSLLNPGCPIPESASAIHGVTDAQVSSAPCLVDVAHEIMRLAEDAIPSAYNASYDRAILHRYIAGSECPMIDPSHGWLCPLVIVRDVDRYVAGSGRHTLARTCVRWMVELDGAHNALADARATGRLLFRLVEAGKLVKAYPLGKLLNHIEARRQVQDADAAAYRAKRASTPPRAEQTSLPIK
jgi:DNA polymerase-3 subunit epsilon